jgi:metal-responsive CopG/Arc/MetJ family transcriptional regulator
METVSIKLEDNFAKDLDKTIKKNHYTTKTEFIREAIRDKMRDLEKEEMLLRAKKLYGASKRKTTDEELHAAREKAFDDI